MEAKSGIYAITNEVTGKKYIGSSIDTDKRSTQHTRRLRAGTHVNSKLQNAWAKYGESSFTFSVIEVVGDKTQLLKREQHWIDTTNAVAEGYNLTPTAGSILGTKFSDESKRRMSKASTGKAKSPEHVANVAAALKGRKMTDEQRQKMRDAKLGKTFGKRSPEVRQKISAALKGRPMSQEHRQKLADAKRGKQQPPELVAKRVAAIKAAREAERQKQTNPI